MSDQRLHDYDESTTVAAPAAQLFDYLSDVSHLPQYFDRMTSAKQAQGDAVDTTARMPDGTEVAGQAWFTVDDAAQSITWGSEGENAYHGGLEVTGDDETSEVRLHLHSSHEGQQITDAIKKSLDTIRQLVETGPAPSS